MKRLINPLILLLSLSFFTHLFSQKVVSLAPGITEIIFKLNSGDLLSGVTKFCDYPEKAKHINKIGGFIDLNLEKIFKKRIKLISLKHRNLSDLYKSILIIADTLKKKELGILIVKRIKRKLKNILLRTKRKVRKKRVLIIISRDPFHLRNITIVGKGDFLNEILRFSGGVNCYNGKINYPTVSIESVINMNPEIIIEFIYFLKKNSSSKIIDQWNGYDQINAVSNSKIFIVKEQFWLRPGPRITLIAEKLFEIINK